MTNTYWNAEVYDRIGTPMRGWAQQVIDDLQLRGRLVKVHGKGPKNDTGESNPKRPLFCRSCTRSCAPLVCTTTVFDGRAYVPT